MTAMLASVVSLDEAKVVADCADVIDLKDPGAGALGALAPARVAEVVQWAAGRYVISAALGDLPMRADVIAAASATMAGTGVDFVKLGLFDVAASAACVRAAAARTQTAGLVAVMFADRAPDFELLDDIAQAGFVGVMLDTADKGDGALLDHFSEQELAAMVSRAHSLGLFVGLAGSLRQADVARLLPCDPDFLGFRGALCEGNQRMRRISRTRALALAGKIRSPTGSRGSFMIDRLRRPRDAGIRPAGGTAGVSR